jgi:hypothetical protein
VLGKFSVTVLARGHAFAILEVQEQPKLEFWVAEGKPIIGTALCPVVQLVEMFFFPRILIDDNPSFISLPETFFADMLSNTQQSLFGSKIAPVSEAFYVNDRFITQKLKILLLRNRAFGNDDEHPFVSALTRRTAKVGFHRTGASS